MKLTIVSWLEPLIDYLWSVRKPLLEEARKNNQGWINFDYPNYGGLPKAIYTKLGPDHVDLIQTFLYDWYVKSKNKVQFGNHVTQTLTNYIVSAKHGWK
jgi:hypothetical protein